MSRETLNMASRAAGRPRAGSGKVAVARRSSVTAMSAIKNPDPETENTQKLPARAARRAEHGTMVLVHEKVLSEISHELGNFFHKLYYWSDDRKEQPAGASTESTAAQMLERTIKNLEEFLKASLDYFHPTRLSLMRMAIPDIVGGLLSQVRAQMNGTPVTVSDRGAWDGNGVMVDPSHLSQALGVAVATLVKQVGPESSVHVEVDYSARVDGRWLEVSFELRRPNDPSPLFRTSRAGVEWAVAQKVVALHGGELVERPGEDGTKNITILLPLT